MKLRYELRGKVFVPQYKKEDGEWKDFTVKHARLSKGLEELCIILGNNQFNSRWASTWHFMPEDGKDKYECSIAFDRELFVNAFLGAAKGIFDGYTTKELDI